MAAATLDIPVEEIAALAETFTFKRFVLCVLAAPFFAIGYLAVYVWTAVTWCYAAYLTGWRKANGPSKNTQIRELRAEVHRLTVENSRFSG